MSTFELESWRRRWQSRSLPAADADAIERLRRRVLSETRSNKTSLIIPILVALLLGGAIVLRALRTEQSIDVLLAVEAWIFILVMWVSCLWIARATWRPLADTTASFVDISIRRREANLRGVMLRAYLYVVQVGIRRATRDRTTFLRRARIHGSLQPLTDDLELAIAPCRT